MPGAGSIRRTFSSLGLWNFRLYTIGQAISLSGTWMQTIGQSWLVLQITGSGTALGLVTALQFLPILVLGPWGGVLADRFSKRSILYCTQTAAGLLALALGILVETGSVRLWMVGVLAAGLGLVTMVDNPTRQTFVFEMVGKEQIQNAVSLNSVLVNLARVVGPAMAGGLIAGVGLAACFFVNAASFIAVLIALRMMRARELHPAPLVARARGQLRDAFRYVRSTPVLRNALLMMAIIGTLSYEFQVILPLFAQFTLGGGAGTYAALTASMGVGSVIGGLYTAGRKTVHPGMLIRAAFLFGVVILAAAIAPNLAVRHGRPVPGRGLLDQLPLARQLHAATRKRSRDEGTRDGVVGRGVPGIDADRWTDHRMGRRVCRAAVGPRHRRRRRAGGGSAGIQEPRQDGTAPDSGRRQDGRRTGGHQGLDSPVACRS